MVFRWMRISQHPWLSAAILGLIVAAFASVFVLSYGPLRDVSLRGRGFVLVPEQSSREIAIRQGDERGIFEFVLRNITDKPVTIYGVQVDCSCVKTTRLPLTIPGGASRQITFEMIGDCSEAGATMRARAILLVDVPSPRLALTMETVCRPADR